MLEKFQELQDISSLQLQTTALPTQSRWLGPDHCTTNFKAIIEADCAAPHIAPYCTPLKLFLYKLLSPNWQLGDGFGDTSPSSQVAGFLNNTSFFFHQTLSPEHWLLSNEKPNLSLVLALAGHISMISGSQVEGV